jgi:hypothetical protein
MFINAAGTTILSDVQVDQEISNIQSGQQRYEVTLERCYSGTKFVKGLRFFPQHYLFLCKMDGARVDPYIKIFVVKFGHYKPCV